VYFWHEPIAKAMLRSFAFLGLLFILLVLPACEKERTSPSSNSAIHYYAHSGTEIIRDAIFLKDGGVAYAGTALSQGYLFVLDADGKERWKAYVGGQEFEEFKSVIELRDGSLLGIGYTDSKSLGVVNANADAWIVKFSSRGEILWQKVMGDKFREVLYAGLEDSQGNLFLVGMQNYSNARSLYAKLDANGNVLYVKTSDIGPWHSLMGGVSETATGDYVIGGINSSSVVSAEANNYVTNLTVVQSSNGSIKHIEIFDAYVRSHALWLAAQFRMDVHVTLNQATIASFFEVPTAKGRVQIIRANLDGSLVFEKKYQGLGNLSFCNLERSTDGGYLLCGASTSKVLQPRLGFQNGKAVLIKLSPDCEQEWISTVGEPTQYQSVKAAAEIPSGYTIAGQSINVKSGVYKMMTYKLNKEGELVYEAH